MGSENSVVFTLRLISTESLPSVCVVDIVNVSARVSTSPVAALISWYWVYTKLFIGQSIEEQDAAMMTKAMMQAGNACIGLGCKKVKPQAGEGFGIVRVLRQTCLKMPFVIVMNLLAFISFGFCGDVFCCLTVFPRILYVLLSGNRCGLTSLGLSGRPGILRGKAGCLLSSS